jgi:hypothetical protein
MVFRGKRHSRETVAIAVVLILSLGGPALADLVNGSFETGVLDALGMDLLEFDGWTTEAIPGSGVLGVGWYGDHKPNYGMRSWWPTDGSHFAWLHTSWTQARLYQQFTASEGDVLTFDYFWDTSSQLPQQGRGTGYLSPMTLFDHSVSSDGDFSATDWIPFTYEIPWSGSFTLLFEVAGSYSSIGVDNVRLTPAAAPVPIPGAALLGALGLSFAGWRLRGRTR